MPAVWAMTEVGTAQLGDPRRVRRVATLLSALAERPGEGLPAACATPAATKAAYRCVANTAIRGEAILEAHSAATIQRLRGEATILALQDTTALDFTPHPAVAEVGPLAYPGQRGLWLHSVLAATTEGTPLGLLHQHTWARDPPRRGEGGEPPPPSHGGEREPPLAGGAGGHPPGGASRGGGPDRGRPR